MAEKTSIVAIMLCAMVVHAGPVQPTVPLAKCSIVVDVFHKIVVADWLQKTSVEKAVQLLMMKESFRAFSKIYNLVVLIAAPI